jgi:pimeloyl-ACP methyl ester carboxylesterase
MGKEPKPYFREAGSGEGVICLHSNAGASAQWRPLMDCLAPDFKVIAPDSLGAGKNPPWPADKVISLEQEVAFLKPIFELAGSPCSLVGHSYGAAVALMAALERPNSVKRLAVYEPTLFSLLDEESPGQPAANGIREAAADATTAVAANDYPAAAHYFLDYWMGEGAWAAVPDQRKEVVAKSMHNVLGWSHALFNNPTPLESFRRLAIPVLYMVGGKSPAAAQGVARLLTSVLPNVTVMAFEKLGHMGPLTHAEQVNEAIAQFLTQD